MTSSPAERVAPVPGLRERKKARTRATIRAEAIRLFAQHGFTAITVEQIAEAAEISPSTFFRYFPTKEAVVITDDFHALVFEAFLAQPAELHPVRAFRTAVSDIFENVDAAGQEQERVRQELIRREPGLRSALLEQLAEGVTELAVLIARRSGRQESDLVVRTLAGAIIGVSISVIVRPHDEPLGDEIRVIGRRMDDALKLLEAIPY